MAQKRRPPRHRTRLPPCADRPTTHAQARRRRLQQGELRRSRPLPSPRGRGRATTAPKRERSEPGHAPQGRVRASPARRLPRPPAGPPLAHPRSSSPGRSATAARTGSRRRGRCGFAAPAADGPQALTMRDRILFLISSELVGSAVDRNLVSRLNDRFTTKGTRPACAPISSRHARSPGQVSRGQSADSSSRTLRSRVLGAAP